jgi:Domain of unknown function (DUF4185)
MSRQEIPARPPTAPGFGLRFAAYPLLMLASTACNPAAFDELLTKETAPADAGAREAAALADGGKPFDASLPGVMDAGRDAARDAALRANADTTVDTAVPVPDAEGGVPKQPDLCGQLRPATPAESGIDPDGGVVFLGALAQSSQVQPRAVTDVSLLGDRYWWLFGAAYKLDSLLLANTDSISTAPLDRPYELAETLPGAGVPASFLPASVADRAQLSMYEQLQHMTGNVISTGVNDGLVFYSPGALSGDANGLALRPLGTRVASVHVDNNQDAQVTPVSELLFGANAPSFRFGLRAEGYIYLYGCPKRSSDSHFECLLARAPVNEATKAASYKFRTTGGWSNDLNAASTVLSDTRDEISVSYNPYLQRYLAAHLVWIQAKLRLQTAPRPEGPWETFADIPLPPPEGGQISHFAGVEHPELSARCGRQLSLTYMHARAVGSELRRLEVNLR